MVLAASIFGYNRVKSSKYVVPILMLIWKFVWLFFKQLVHRASSIIFGVSLQGDSTVSHTNSYVVAIICMTIFWTDRFDISSASFGIQNQRGFKVWNTISHVALRICMTIFQTASLSSQQHHVLKYNHN